MIFYVILLLFFRLLMMVFTAYWEKERERMELNELWYNFIDAINFFLLCFCNFLGFLIIGAVWL